MPRGTDIHSIANMPVHHLVFLRLADDADSDAVMDALRGLVGVIPGLISFAGGANTSTEGEQVTGHASCSRSQDHCTCMAPACACASMHIQK